MQLHLSPGYQRIASWLSAKGLHPFAFQEEAWQHIAAGKSGLVNAPTGCGKTFSVFLGSLIRFINQHPEDYQTKTKSGLQLIWITPLRALAKDIGRAMEEAIGELGMNWSVGIRNGDTTTAERARQKKQLPEVLIITPESLHLFLASKGYADAFKTVQVIAIDEWHELMGSKRGVQVELAISRIVNGQWSMVNKKPMIWGISATIGNLEEAKEVLLSPLSEEGVIVKAHMKKQIEIESVLPDEIENYPWAGHLGIKLIHKVIPIIEQSTTTLIFINTRGMSERWYQELLNHAPELAGAIALHHGSIEQELRLWVEEALHTAKLKAVVCTASLDLGVDFRPVETVIQVGSPKGVSRFLQRAGRSGHSPDAVSKIYFLPTHSLELVEAAALKNAIDENLIESKEPMLLCFDVLIQYLNTLAISDGFKPEEIFKEIKSTYCFRDLNENEWHEVLQFLVEGGKALHQYDDYKKIEVIDGVYRIQNRRLAMRHRMNIGTIVSDAMMKVKMVSGGYVGVIEEYFITRLEPGDSFTLAGRNLELVQIKDMTAFVKKSTSKKTIVPSWNGGRMSLTANLGKKLRETFNEVSELEHSTIQKTKKKKNTASLTGADNAETWADPAPELIHLSSLFQLQKELSHIPKDDELLIEQHESKDGYHLLVYPFEGRQVHEAMSAILAYRIGKIAPLTFSIAMNDYGFELLCDQPIPVDDTNASDLFTLDYLTQDIQRSVNSTEMARRKFRDIAVIGGLIIQSSPGEQKKARHLQASASLLFNVFSEYDPKNVLLRQAYQEVFDQQMEEVRLRNAFNRIRQSKIILTFPKRFTPLSFPIIADGLNRNNLSSEKLEDRIRRMQAQLNNAWSS
ncbi:ligase-associated DNA damage response DEXH box helicase [Lacibacter sediminis]|uniref:Ligase-associated DNA damage response DEXH box helicase n=1 Tax=Lacibacter sediminis TaxID=2760713 RepID=A0A7G5XD11_9BACT|nr:ligase-associated DNA damage response DEXH box helicase [Lacibacter sediminis]QNA43364.1 ligase-associated DNA damage response DEXH box helicase [Lacibacter sediminis]